MKNNILSSIIAVICTAAICVTAFMVTNNVTSKKTEVPKYMTEEQAIEYIGVNKVVFELLKEDLKYFKGAYEAYTYIDGAGKEVTITVYKKDKLDEAVDKYMAEISEMNFKYIQEAKTESAQ